MSQKKKNDHDDTKGSGGWEAKKDRLFIDELLSRKNWMFKWGCWGKSSKDTIYRVWVRSKETLREGVLLKPANYRIGHFPNAWKGTSGSWHERSFEVATPSWEINSSYIYQQSKITGKDPTHRLWLPKPSLWLLLYFGSILNLRILTSFQKQT